VHYSRALTKYLNLTGKQFKNLKDGERNLHHEGRCYRNSKHSPGQAEECAFEKVGDVLLDLPDDEAIFADVVVTDGDTRGSHKFILMQRNIMGEIVDGIGEQLPDFGHFIKCISNALYKLAEKNSTLQRKGLLERPRIRTLSEDVARHIHSYHDELVLLDKEDFDQHSEARERFLGRLASIVPHHCGDHSKCEPTNCAYSNDSQNPKEDSEKARKMSTKALASTSASLQEDTSGGSQTRLDHGSAHAIQEPLRFEKPNDFYNHLLKDTDGTTCRGFFLELAEDDRKVLVMLHQAYKKLKSRSS
jgi:hypothetical protein